MTLAIALAACAIPQVTDPNAVAPRYERWEVVVPRAKDVVYGAALRVLTDSSYTTASASQEAGVLVTNGRRASDVERGTQQVKSIFGGRNSPVTLRLVLTPAGPDSTRLAIVGTYRNDLLLSESDTPSRPIPIAANTDEWRFVRGIGEAILANVR